MHRRRTKIDRRIRDGRRSVGSCVGTELYAGAPLRNARYVTESWPRFPARLVVRVAVVLTGSLVKPARQSPDGPGCLHFCEGAGLLGVRYYEMRGLAVVVQMLSVHGPN